MFLPGWPNSDRWLVNHCALPSIGQTWVLASTDAVFEMDVLIRTLKRLLMESKTSVARERLQPWWDDFPHIYSNKWSATCTTLSVLWVTALQSVHLKSKVLCNTSVKVYVQYVNVWSSNLKMHKKIATFLLLWRRNVTLLQWLCLLGWRLLETWWNGLKLSVPEVARHTPYSFWGQTIAPHGVRHTVINCLKSWKCSPSSLDHISWEKNVYTHYKHHKI
jgi:hypothetical protein